MPVRRSQIIYTYTNVDTLGVNENKVIIVLYFSFLSALFAMCGSFKFARYWNENHKHLAVSVYALIVDLFFFTAIE